MLNEVLNYTKKYYPKECIKATHKVVIDGIEGDYSESVKVGQYINFYCSDLNDGTYEVTNVTTSKVTLNATLKEEETEFYIFVLRLPSDFINLVNDISTYTTQNPTSQEISSETQGNRSVSYATSSDGSGGNWINVFKTQLSNYRNVYDDRYKFVRW